MVERQVEIPETEGEESDNESQKSVRMEMVEVIRLHCSTTMPEGWCFFSNVRCLTLSSRSSSSSHGSDHGSQSPSHQGSQSINKERWTQGGKIKLSSFFFMITIFSCSDVQVPGCDLC